jgi:hypothetical protein
VKFFETRATNEVINMLGIMPFRHIRGVLVKLPALFITTQDATEQSSVYCPSSEGKYRIWGRFCTRAMEK